MKTTIITMKNPKTEMADTFKVEVEFVDWGFLFYVDDELTAYKSAYYYKDSKYGCVVKFAPGNEKWQVTVYNESGGRLFGTK